MDWILAILEWIVSVLGVMTASLALTPPVPTGLARVAAMLFCGLLLIAGSVFATGVLGSFNGLSLAALGAVQLTVALRFGGGRLRENADYLASGGRQCLAVLKRHPVLGTAVLLAVALILARGWAHTWYLSPYIWDALSYHLPKVGDWVHDGALVAHNTAVDRTFLPANMELIQAWFVVFLRHDIVVEAAGLPWQALAAISVYTLAFAIGAKRSGAILAAITYAATPCVMLASVSGKNDIAVAALYLFSAAMTLTAARHPKDALTLVGLAAAAALFGAGVKPTSVFMLPGLALLAIGTLRRQPEGDSERAPRRIGWRPLVFLLSVALILGGFWYARNTVRFGNPFHPMNFRVAGKLVFGDGLDHGQQGGFRLETLKINAGKLLNALIFDQGVYTADLGGQSGWGWVFVTCGLPACCVVLLASGLFRWMAAAFILSIAVLLGSVSPDPWYSRFLLWFPAIGSIAVAALLQRMSDTARHAFVALCLAGLVLNMLASLGTGYHETGDWRAAMRCPPLSRHTWLADDREHDIRQVPAGEVFGYAGHPNIQMYGLHDARFTRRFRVVPLWPKPQPIAKSMKDAGVRYLVIIDQFDRPRLDLLEQDCRDGLLEKLGEHLYRLTKGSKP